ncbi:CPBP family intramembrane metalloprotease [Chryseobacterium daecheongense]|nr:CPBP family intramembrane metalloprotease [Chryseobacterium daecheongense]
MSKTVYFYTVFILGFLTYYFFDLFCFKTIQNFSNKTINNKVIDHVIAYSVTLIPLILTAKLLFPKKKLSELFSVDKPIFVGYVVACVTTLPMLIGYFLFFHLVKDIHFDSLFINTACAALFEEIIFRAFLIGILYRYTGMGFITSILFGSLLFAQVHLYQSSDTKEIIEILSITFLGSILFAWIYFEWNFNLWIAVFVHFFMNLYWEIFAVSDNVSGNLYGNIFKFLSVLLLIGITIYYKRKKKIPFNITMKSLFLKRREIEQ